MPTSARIYINPFGSRETSVTLAHKPRFLLRDAAAADPRVLDSGDTRAASSRLISGVRNAESSFPHSRKIFAQKARPETFTESVSLFTLHPLISRYSASIQSKPILDTTRLRDWRRSRWDRKLPEAACFLAARKRERAWTRCMCRGFCFER